VKERPQIPYSLSRASPDASVAYNLKIWGFENLKMVRTEVKEYRAITIARVSRRECNVQFEDLMI
jgi:hypothetical protein